MLIGSGKKKLQDAARHWLNAARPRGQDELHDDLRFFGIDPEEAELDLDENDRFPVLQSNWNTVLAFLAVQTQWRTNMSGLAGFDYAGIETAFRLRRRRLRKPVFEGLQVMEGAVLSALAEQRARA